MTTEPWATNAAGRAGSIRVFVTQAVYKRHEKDLQVEHQRPVFDVIQVVLDAHADRRIAAPAVHLRPAGDAGADFVAEHVVRELGAELFAELRPLGARADHAHLAGDDVPELRQLVDRPGPDD